MDDRGFTGALAGEDLGEGTVAQAIPKSPSKPLTTPPGRKPLNRMTPRQRQEFVEEHARKGARLRDALLAAIEKYPGGMHELQRRVRFPRPPEGGGLAKLIERLTDHRQNVVTPNLFTIRQICNLTGAAGLDEMYRDLWPDRYAVEVVQEAERDAKRQQASRAFTAVPEQAGGAETQATAPLDNEAVAARWGAVMVRFGTLCMSLGMKNDPDSRQQSGELVAAYGSLERALRDQDASASEKVGHARRAMLGALAPMRNGPLGIAVMDLERELQALEGAVRK